MEILTRLAREAGACSTLEAGEEATRAAKVKVRIVVSCILATLIVFVGCCEYRNKCLLALVF